MENDPSDDRSPPANLPVPSEEAPPPPREKPYRVRHDGWTAERQNIFIESLAKTRCVRDASRMAEISATSAYRHRKRSPAFAERWALALRRAETTIGEVAWKRAVEGVEEDIWYHGKVVGQRTKYAHDMLRLLYQHDTNSAGRDARGRFAPAGEAGGDAGVGAMIAQQQPALPAPGSDPDWAPPEQSQDRLAEKLQAISDKLVRAGSRSLNIRTGQGMTHELVDAVQRFVAGGRVMLPEEMKWLDGEAFEQAKAEFLARHPGGVAQDARGRAVPEKLRTERGGADFLSRRG